MKKRMAIVIILLLLVFGGLYGFNLFKAKMIANYFKQPRPPVTISAQAAKQVIWRPELSAVGNFVARKGVDITPETAGIIEKIEFNSGQSVEANTLLVQLDDAIDQATMKDNEAMLDLAKLNFKRQLDLLKKRATPSSQVDETRAKLKQAEATLAKTNALIRQKQIRAPFAGQLGIRKVNLGQYVTPGTTTVVTLQSLDPLFIEFNLPEQDLPKVKMGDLVKLTVDALPNQAFAGNISAIDAKVDPQTHNVLVQASVPNPEKKLYPGMFASIQIQLPAQNAVVTVPATAISYSLYGDSVFIVKTEGNDKSGKPIKKAYRSFVKVGDKRENRVVITDGVKAGDIVVDSGQLKLHNATPVQINNKTQLGG